jgi:rod shape determining protein RodA
MKLRKLQLQHVDWITYLLTLPILLAGLISMYSFRGDNTLFFKQLIWIPISFIVSIAVSMIDTRIFRKSYVISFLYAGIIFLLAALFVLGSAWKGARGWFNLGFFAFQPADLMKLVLILVFAKYFSRRHVEIAHVKHIIISGIYVAIPALLVLLQPDFGSAIIYIALWFGLILISGINRKHLLIVFTIGAIGLGGLWGFVFSQYQKDRIISFIAPLTDIRGSGWNAFQSTVAVGSGQILGKGIGEGTQSRLKFLPEYQTDFIFASFAEEWGFIGVTLLFLCFGIFIFRILSDAIVGATNFETLYASGFIIFIIVQFVVHVGMNIGLMPVTGQTLPFMSYGGSHLLTEFVGLGILMGMRRHRRVAHKDDMKNEFLGF